VAVRRDRDGMATSYDVIVVGARCAGSPTAMLLARQGLSVLLVDQAEFPSDTLSTHIVHPPGVAALRRWGLLHPVMDAGTPPFDTYTFDFGEFVLSGTPRMADGSHTSYAPRRTVLDKILADGAVRAGAELRELFTFEDVVREGDTVVGITGRDRDGRRVTERARVVVGADGRNSEVAARVGPEQYNETPKLQISYYTYFSGLPVKGMETVIRPERGFAAVPTNDGLTLVVAAAPMAEASQYKADIEGTFASIVALEPEFAGRVAAATREGRFYGGAVPGFFRKPYGPGWALVGDAAYNKDPITAQGISDSFRDAELLATAIGDVLRGDLAYDDALAGYQRTRDEHVLPMYEFTAGLASLEPPPPDQAALLEACSRDQDSMDEFVAMYSGVLSPAEFFSSESIGRIIARAEA